ncbi:hypothetical protein HRI_000902500 [Hibiscus trionum]|uniref:RNase H type-1 domain-containing protein n=1 Tax=Hibiscus trionum TaxID=183268 RepID=A0A9W7LPG7_HIBTR|nr:hypothetical protein HRI_000902500 [Hibiscus trionum]
MFQFSEKCGSGPPILAELLAIKRGLQLFNARRDCEGCRPILEGDSTVALTWIKNPTSCLELFKRLVEDIVTLGNLRECLFRSIGRALNLDADALAKARIG